MPVETVTTDCRSDNLETRFATVGSRLTSGLRDILVMLPGQPRRPRDVQRVLGVRKDVASRMIRATHMVDPLAALLLMPGPVPLRHVIGAARSLGVAETALATMDHAVAEFDRLITEEIGDRVAFDGVVSALLPEARARQEVFCRQSVFRGMAQIKGACAEVMLNTAVIWPSQERHRLDGIWIIGWYGLRRTRPGAPVYFSSGALGSLSTPGPFLTLDNREITEPSHVILRPYSTIPADGIRLSRVGRTLQYVLDGNRVGAASSVNITVANYAKACLSSRTIHSEPRCNGPTMEITTPSRLAVLDVLIHHEAFQATDPTLLVYDTTVNGLADMNDPRRDVDRLDTTDSIHRIDVARTGLRVREVPDYPNILSDVLGARGLMLTDFKAYRCRVRYPLYGAQYAFAFPVPRVDESEG